MFFRLAESLPLAGTSRNALNASRARRTITLSKSAPSRIIGTHMPVPPKHLGVTFALVTCLGAWSNVSALIVAPDQRIAPAEQYVNAEPSVAVWNNVMVATWAQPDPVLTGRGAGWAYSLDGGVSWTPGALLGILSSLYSVLWEYPAPCACADDAGWFTIGAVIGTNSGFRLVVYRGREQNGAITMGQPVETGVIIPGPPTVTFVASRLACDPVRGYLYFVYAVMDQSGGYPYQGVNPKISIHIVRSLDGGATWSPSQQLSPGFATHMPTAAVGPDGELVVAWQDYATNQMVGRESVDFGATFGTEFVAGPVVDARVVQPVGWRIGDFVAPTYSWIRQVPA